MVRPDLPVKSSKAASISRPERYVAWWSSSTLVTTATSGDSLRNERSDSSASITSHSPSPQPALREVVRSSPPIRYEGAAPASMSTWAHMQAVVVLPCVPAIATQRLRWETSARRSPRWRMRCAFASSGLSGAIAVDTTTSAPSGTLRPSCPIAGSIPSARSGCM
jgi:hypothetical protein